MDPALAGRRPVPTEPLEPMRASPGPLPRDDGEYAYEILWGGIRTLFCSDAGHTKIIDAGGNEIGDRYPEVKRLGRALGMPGAVLDGVIGALDESGRARPDLLERRQSLKSKGAIERAAKSQPVTYIIFDLMFFDGYSTGDLPYAKRHMMLEDIVPDGLAWRVPPSSRVPGAQMMAAAHEQNIEAVIAKRLDSGYTPGGGDGSWIEVRRVG